MREPIPIHRSWTAELDERARRLRWLLLDVDGVLTDGRLWFSAEGEAMKSFDVRDGLAVQLARRAGLEVGILSARSSPVVTRRAADLGLTEVLQGEDDKLRAFEQLLARHALAPDQVAYLADDLQDLAVLGRCGLPASPADAVAEVRARVLYVTEAAGGRGAVRELVERLLTARGAWSGIVAGCAGSEEPDDS